jgi:hypothetical protein
MPNWASNTIITDNPAIGAVLRKAHEEESGLFASTLPVPEELVGTEQLFLPTGRVSARMVDGEYQRITGKEAHDLRAAYGSTDQLAWQIEHWGTKWEVEDFEFEEGPDGTFTVRFLSAWTPPVAFVAKLASMYPQGRLEIAYAEGGMAYFGAIRYVDGEVVDSWESNEFWGEPESDDEEPDPTPRCAEHLAAYGLETGG